MSFLLINKVKSVMSTGAADAKKIMEEAWGHYARFKNEEKDINIRSTNMEEHIKVINRYLANADESIRRGDYSVAEQWLESAEKEVKLIEEFEDVLIGLERKELSDIMKMAKHSHKLKRTLDELRGSIMQAKRKAA